MSKLGSTLTASQPFCLPSHVYGTSISLFLRAEWQRRTRIETLDCRKLSQKTARHTTRQTALASSPSPFGLRGQNEHQQRRHHSIGTPIPKVCYAGRGQNHSHQPNPASRPRCSRRCCGILDALSTARRASTSLKGSRYSSTSASKRNPLFPIKASPAFPPRRAPSSPASNPLFATPQDADGRYTPSEHKIRALWVKATKLFTILQTYNRGWLEKEVAACRKAAREEYDRQKEQMRIAEKVHEWEVTALKPLNGLLDRSARTMKLLEADLNICADVQAKRIRQQELLEALELRRQEEQNVYFQELDEEDEELGAIKARGSIHMKTAHLIDSAASMAALIAKDISSWVLAGTTSGRATKAAPNRDLPRLMEAISFVNDPGAQLTIVCMFWLRPDFLNFASGLASEAHRWRHLNAAAKRHGSVFAGHAFYGWYSLLYVAGHRLVNGANILTFQCGFVTGAMLKRIPKSRAERIETLLLHITAVAATIHESVIGLMGQGHFLLTGSNAGRLRMRQINTMQPIYVSQSGIRQLTNELRKVVRRWKDVPQLDRDCLNLERTLRPTWNAIGKVERWTWEGDVFYGRTAPRGAVRSEHSLRYDPSFPLQPLKFLLPVQQSVQDDACWQYSDAVGPGGRRVSVEYVRSPSTAEQVVRGFQSSPVLGLAIVGKGGRDQLTTNSRFKVQALLLANEERIAIFHLAIFQGNRLDDNIPLLRGVLEDKNILKVGVNMRHNYDMLSHFEGVNMAGYRDLRAVAKSHQIFVMSDWRADASQGAKLSVLSKMFFGKALRLAPTTDYMSKYGLSRMGDLLHCANLPYAALHLFHAMQSQSPLPDVPATYQKSNPTTVSTKPDGSTWLPTQLGPINIDPLWLWNDYCRAAFPQNRMSREACLGELTKELAIAHIKETRLELRSGAGALQLRRQRQGRLERVKACFRAVVFGETPAHVRSGSSYTTDEIRGIAAYEGIRIPPQRHSMWKEAKEQELEEKRRQWEQTPRGRAETILKQLPSRFRQVSETTLFEERRRLKQKGRDDVLMTIMWYIMEMDLKAVAAEFSTMPEHVFDAVMNVRSLTLFNLETPKLHALVLEYDPAKLEEDAYHDLLPVEKMPGDAEDSLFPLKPNFANVPISPNMSILEDDQANSEENAHQDLLRADANPGNAEDSMFPLEPSFVNVAFLPFSSSVTEAPTTTSMTQPGLEVLQSAERGRDATAKRPPQVSPEPNLSSVFRPWNTAVKREHKLKARVLPITEHARQPPNRQNRSKPKLPRTTKPAGGALNYRPMSKPRSVAASSTLNIRKAPPPQTVSTRSRIRPRKSRVLDQDGINRRPQGVLNVTRVASTSKSRETKPVTVLWVKGRVRTHLGSRVVQDIQHTT